MPELIWTTNGGIFCGFPAKATEGKAPPYLDEIRYTGDRHYCLIGPNGSGKTKRVIVPALTELTGWSICVADTKGELCAMTQKHRQDNGNQIIRLNPFDVHGLGSDGFNPIAALDYDIARVREGSNDFEDDARELAEAVIQIQGSEPHFAQAAQELMTSLIMYVRLILPKNGSFRDVREFLSRDDAGWRALITGGRNTDPNQYDLFEKEPEKVLEKDPNYKPPVLHFGKLYPGMVAASRMYRCPAIAHKARRFGSLSAQDREMHSVISTALAQSYWMDSEPVIADLEKPPIDFSEAKHRPITVYLILPANRLASHAPWLRLMITGFLRKLMKDTKPGKVPIMLMLDEYAALAGGSNYGRNDNGDGFPVVARNMAMFRGYGIKLFTAWQDLAQAKRIYGDGFESFLGNAGVIQVFAPQDIVTAKYVSERTGETMKRSMSRSQSRNPNAMSPMGVLITDSFSINLVQGPRMYPQDVRNLDDGFSLIFSHRAKGTVRSYMPWPAEMPHLKHVMALDPSAEQSSSASLSGPSDDDDEPPSRTSFFSWLRRWLRRAGT